MTPRLDGVSLEHQLWQGEATAARLARTLIEANVADPGDWATAKQNPFEFIKRALDRWLSQHGDTVIREKFLLDVLLSTSLDRYFVGDGKAGDASRMFLTLEPDSAGYVILGPSLRLLEGVHPRLPATFLHLFLGRLTDGSVFTTTGTHLIVSRGFAIGMNRTQTEKPWNCPISIGVYPSR